MMFRFDWDLNKIKKIPLTSVDTIMKKLEREQKELKNSGKR